MIIWADSSSFSHCIHLQTPQTARSVRLYTAKSPSDAPDAGQVPEFLREVSQIWLLGNISPLCFMRMLTVHWAGSALHEVFVGKP